MSRQQAPRIIIVGAGSTGLLLAQGLKQHGIICQVFEREDASTYQSRPREWGMTLHWGGTFISKCIPAEMRSRLNEGICCDPYYEGKDLTLPHYNAKTGEKLFDMPGEEPRRISRKKLRNFLSQGLDVQYGQKLVSIQKQSHGTAMATFADGTTAVGDLIIGCDGANSAVRACLLGKEMAAVEDLDIQMLNVSCSFPRETALLQRKGHPVFKNSYHPDGYMWWNSIQDVQNPEDPETWLFQNVISWIGPPRATDFADSAAIMAYWKDKAKLFAEPWRTVGRDLPDTLPVTCDRTTLWRPSMDWYQAELAGVVTIAGDAAHTMPAHRGQGLNNALEDAAKLVDQVVAASVGTKSLQQAVVDFETEMKERVLIEIPLSIAQAKMVHNFDTLMQAPFFKHGMNKYRADLEAKGQRIEVATAAGGSI